MTNQKKSADINNIRNITISGRIGTGKSTLANHLAAALGWKILDGGKVFRKLVKELGIHISEKQKIPDKFDIAFENETKEILKNEKNYIIQNHLAGFVAQGITGAYKILVVCEDDEGEDKQSIRIDRIMNRDLISAQDAKKEIKDREEEDLKKFRRLYVNNNPNWVYWDEKYFDLKVNTYSLNQKDALSFVLKKIGFKPKS